MVFGIIGNDTIKGFEIGYRITSGNMVFEKARATIEGNNAVVWFDGNQHPTEVRYAWLLAGEANLFDQEGLPAFPFTTKIKTADNF